jgi:hypothetical protein
MVTLPHSAVKRMTVLRKPRGRAFPVGMEEAVERRWQVHPTQTSVGRFLEEISDSLESWLTGFVVRCRVSVVVTDRSVSTTGNSGPFIGFSWGKPAVRSISSFH